MPVYRVTLVWNMSVMGVSETWYTNGNVSAGAIPKRIEDLIKARAAMMYTNQEIVGLRIADLGDVGLSEPTRRKSIFLPPGKRPLPPSNSVIDIPTKGNFAVPVDANHPDQLRAALQLRLTYQDGRQTTRYLSGMPDDVTTYEPGTTNLLGNPLWWTRYSAWVDLITQGWAIRVRSQPPTDPKYRARRVVRREASPSYFGVAVNASDSPNIVAGDRVHLEGWRFKPAQKTSLNGQYYVDEVNTTLLPDQVVYYLRGTELVDPTRIGILGTIQRVRYTLASVQQIQWIRTGIHKRGRPSPTPRGRRATRVSYDP